MCPHATAHGWLTRAQNGAPQVAFIVGDASVTVICLSGDVMDYYCKSCHRHYEDCFCTMTTFKGMRRITCPQCGDTLAEWDVGVKAEGKPLVVKKAKTTPTRTWCCRLCNFVDENEDAHHDNGGKARCSKYGDDIRNIDECVCTSFTDDPLLITDALRIQNALIVVDEFRVETRGQHMIYARLMEGVLDAIKRKLTE